MKDELKGGSMRITSNFAGVMWMDAGRVCIVEVGDNEILDEACATGRGVLLGEGDAEEEAEEDSGCGCARGAEEIDCEGLMRVES